VSDEELRRHLSTSVPDHGDGFWEGLEHRLATVHRPDLRVVPPTAPADPGMPGHGVPAPAPVLPEIPEILVSEGEEIDQAGRPRGVGEPVGSPERRARQSAQTPWGAKDMSFQHDPSDESRTVTRARSGWTKLAVAAAAVAVLGGVAVGAERGGIFSTSRVSWTEEPGGTTGATGTTGTGGTQTTTDTPSTAPDQGGPAAPAGGTGGAGTGSSPKATANGGQGCSGGHSCAGATLLGLDVIAVAKVTSAIPVDLAGALKLVEATKTSVLGVPEKALGWNDKHGLNVVLVTREVVRDAQGVVVKVVVRAFVVAKLGSTTKLIGHLVQQGTGLALNTLQIRDGNVDGIAEVVLGLVSSAKTKLSPVTMIVHELVGGNDYTLQGVGLPETIFSALSPTELLALPNALLSPVLSAVPGAGDWPSGTYTDALGLVNQFLH